MLSTLRKKASKGSIKKMVAKDPFVIPLEPVVSKSVEEAKTMKFKLWSDPSTAASQTYEMTAQVFTKVTPGEWLEQRKDITQVLIGQNITSGPNQFAMARRLLADKALNNFETSVNTRKAEGVFNETSKNLKIVLADISIEIFPERAIQLQRRALRRNLRKPADMTTATYYHQLKQLSDDLRRYPGGTLGDCLTEEDLKEILEFTLPAIWRALEH